MDTFFLTLLLLLPINFITGHITFFDMDQQFVWRGVEQFSADTEEQHFLCPLWQDDPKSEGSGAEESSVGYNSISGFTDMVY